MSQLSVLKGPFDVETHKATFIDYLEVVITENGTVVYACPGHVEVMERIALAKGISPDSCPRSHWLDYDGWLRDVTGCVCVWNEGYQGKPNEAQMQAIDMLRREGLLRLKGSAA